MKRKGIEYKYVILLLCLCVAACKPVPPVTSSIVVDMGKPATPVNAELYGLSLEEINHAIEGGIYAELIQNRSFEAGVVPEGCSYDPFTGSLNTPSGWQVPFVTPNAIPGWRALNEQTKLYIDTWSRPINEANERSLWVYVPYPESGGVVAEGFGGINIRKGAGYDMSLYIRGQWHARVNVGLRDAMGGRRLSEVVPIEFTREWMHISHTFTALESDTAATLVFSSDSAVLFNIDIVSLLPSDTWKGRKNGLRADLMNALAALNPQFVRFPGGASVESYASSAVPEWTETLAPVEQRRSIQSMYGYITSQGLGFHDYLQLCEDLNAKPVYVANAGLMNQRYRTRYHDRPVDYWAEQILTAIAYANEPADSIYGQMRLAHGHRAQFNLSRIEIGSEQRGREYLRRYRQLREETIASGVALICNTTEGIRDFANEWADTHYEANADYLISSYNVFDLQNLTLQTPMQFVGEFGASYSPEAGTLRAAVGEAAFMIGAERNPNNVKGIAYAPLLGHASFPMYGHPAILFDAARVVKTPSYYVMEIFANSRGDELLTTQVNTYDKPLVNTGGASIIMYDYQFGVKDLAWNGESVPTAFVKDNRTHYKWSGMQPASGDADILSLPEEFDFEQEQQKVAAEQIVKDSKGQPADILRRYMTFGDPDAYNYTVSASIKEVQVGGMIEIHVRDNGEVEEPSDYISLIFKDGKAALYHCGGFVTRLLADPVAVSLARNQWHKVDITCDDRNIRCYMDQQLLIEATVPTRPSLLTVATRETATNTVILKVVNTTFHEEWCSLNISGGNFENEVEMAQLAGRPNDRNTLQNPDAITPRIETIKFSFKRPLTYAVPGNSITVFRLKLK